MPAAWTGFCRDAKSQRLEELVLIFANGQYDENKPTYTFTPTGLPPTVVYSDIGCRQWKGTITATSLDPDYQYHVIDIKVRYDYNLTAQREE